MDFRNAKDIKIGSKDVSKVYVDNRLVWEKGCDLTLLHIDFDNITKLTDNVGYIYYGPKGAIYDPSKMSLNHIRTVYGGSAYWDIDVTLHENDIEKVDTPEYEGRIPFNVDIQYNGSGVTGMYPGARWNFTATYDGISTTNDVGCVPTWKPQNIWLYSPEEEISSTGEHTIYINYDPVGSDVTDYKHWSGLSGACYIPEVYIQYSEPTHDDGGSCSTIEATLNVDRINRSETQTIRCAIGDVWSSPYDLNVKLPIQISTLHIDFDKITELENNVGYIYYGPKGAIYDPSKINLSHVISKNSTQGIFAEYEKIDLSFDPTKNEKVSDEEYEGRIPFIIDTPLHDDWESRGSYRGVYPDVEWTLTTTYDNIEESKVISCDPKWTPQNIWLTTSPQTLDKSYENSDLRVYMNYLPVGAKPWSQLLGYYSINHWRPQSWSVYPPYVTYEQRAVWCSVIVATIRVVSVDSNGTDTFTWNTNGLSASVDMNVVVPEPEPSGTEPLSNVSFSAPDWNLGTGQFAFNILVGPKDVNLDDIELELDQTNVIIGPKGIYIDHIEKSDDPEFDSILYCYIDIEGFISTRGATVTVFVSSKSTGWGTNTTLST